MQSDGACSEKAWEGLLLQLRSQDSINPTIIQKPQTTIANSEERRDSDFKTYFCVIPKCPIFSENSQSLWRNKKV
jgi:hypothetical protein